VYIVNNQQIDLSKLDPRTGSLVKQGSYVGTHPIEKEIANAWFFFWQNFQMKGDPVIFVCPNIGSGIGVGSHGSSTPRSVIKKAGGITWNVIWCDTDVIQPNGSHKYSPLKYSYDKRQISLDPNMQMEEIIFHYLFSARGTQMTFDAQTINQPGKKTEKKKAIFVLDRDLDAQKFLAEKTKNSSVIFILTNKNSWVSKDRDAKEKLALYWGLSQPEKLTDNVLTQKLLEAVDVAEEAGNKKYGVAAFEKVVDNLVQGTDRMTEILINVQKAVDKRVVKYIEDNMAVSLWGVGGELKRLCKVPTYEKDTWKRTLAKYLLSHEDDYETIQSSIEEIAESKTAKKWYIPTDLTQEFFTDSEKDGGIKFSELKSLTKFTHPEMTNADVNGSKRADLAELMIKYLITDKNEIPEERITRELQLS
jgi:hypothetical protein